MGNVRLECPWDCRRKCPCGNIRIVIRDFKSLRVELTIRDNLVNIQIDNFRPVILLAQPEE